MPSHNSTVVGHESLTRSCGHVEDFVQYSKDPFRDRRREKFLARKCFACHPEATPGAAGEIIPPQGGSGTAPPKGKGKAAAKAGANPAAPQVNYLAKDLPVGCTIMLAKGSTEWQAMFMIDKKQVGELLTGPSPGGLLDRLANQFLGPKTEEKADGKV
jgi:hypothetical protein